MSSEHDLNADASEETTETDVKIQGKSNGNDTSRSRLAGNVTVGTIAEARSGAPADKDGGDPSRPFMYRDFGHIAEEDFDADYELDQEGLLQALEESTALAAAQAMQQSIAQASFMLPDPSRNIIRASGWVRSQRFPVKLYALLSQPNLSPVITWMPHGRSWKVLKPRIFETSVLPVFFESDNYHSFNRVINAWSFRRKSTGPDRGSYFHELFLRGKPHLQKYMRRLPRTHKKETMKKEEEPDFFELTTISPLPSLEEAKSAIELRKVERIHQNNHLDRETPGGVVVHTSTSSNLYGVPVFAAGHPLPPPFFPPSSAAFPPSRPF